MNIISLNQLIQIFKDFADAHLQLNDFGYGDTSMIGTSKQMNPAYLWITHRTPSTIGVTNKTQIPEMVLTFIIVDKINIQKNYEDTNGYESNNEQEILSDTFQIMQDLINFISVYLGQYGVMLTEDPISPEIVQDETTDKVTGWMCDIRLKLIHSNCITPLGNVTINVPTQHQVQEQWLTCNDLANCHTFQEYAYTGGTYNSGTSEVQLVTLNGNTLTITGFTGGQDGSSGTSGTNGTSGINGTSGTNGTNGTSGLNGTSGTSGAQGTSGSSGSSGSSGNSGSSGSSGTSGVNGTSGTNGSSGINGTSGTNGSSGTNGTSGVNGTSGTSAFAYQSFSSVATASGIVVDASVYNNGTWIASFNNTRNLTVSNLTSGSVLIFYIKNTNAITRLITFTGSSTTTGHVSFEGVTQASLALNASVALQLTNINGVFYGSIL